MYKRILALVAVLLFAFGMLAGCGAKDTVKGDTKSKASKALADTEDYDLEEQDAAETVTGAAERKITKSIEITTKTNDYDSFVKTLDEKLLSNGGYVESSTAENEADKFSSGRNYRLVARVPQDKSNAFVSYIQENSTVSAMNVTTEDITDSYVDTQGRLSALRTEKATLEGLLSKAKNLSDTLTIQERLTAVIGEIEAAERKLRSYDNRVAYDTVDVSVFEVDRVVTQKDTVWSRIGSGFTESLSAIGSFFTELFVFVVGALPYLLILAAVVFLTIGLIRRGAKKSKRVARTGPVPIAVNEMPNLQNPAVAGSVPAQNVPVAAKETPVPPAAETVQDSLAEASPERHASDE